MSKYSFELNNTTTEYEITSTISFEQFINSYTRVISTAFPPVIDEEIGEPTYSPVLQWLAEGYCAIDMFTDINVSDKDNDYIWEICMYTDVLEQIFSDPKRKHIASVLGALTQRYIEDYKTRMLPSVKRNVLYSTLIDVVSPSEDEFNLKNVSEAISKIDKLSEAEILKAIVSSAKDK